MMRVLGIAADALVLVVTARGLGAEGRGTYALIVLGSSLAQVPLLGIATPLASEFARQRATLGQLRAASLVIAAGGGGVIATALAAFSIATWPDQRAFAIAAAVVPPLMLLAFQQALALAQGRVVHYGLMFVIPSLISGMALTVGVLTTGEALPSLAIWAGAQWVAPLAILALDVRNAPFRFGGLRPLVRRLTVSGAPISVASAISRLNYRVDVLVVAALLSRGDVGRYSVAVTGGETLWQLSRAVVTGAYRSIITSAEPESRRIVVRSVRHSSLLLLVAGVLAIVASVALIPAIFGDQYRDVWKPFALLVPGTAAFGASEVFRTYFTVRLERSFEFLATTIVSVIVTVAAAFALVPLIGISGAAIATTIAYGCMATILLVRFIQSGGDPHLRSYLPGRSDLADYARLARSLRPRRSAPTPPAEPPVRSSRPRGEVWASGRPVTRMIAFGGDFVPGDEALRAGAAELAARLRLVLPGASSLVVNLECAVDVGDLEPVPKSGLGSYLGVPPAALDVLSALDAEVVGLANNHIYDYGVEGLERTIAALEARGLRGVGAGRTLADAPEVDLLDGPGGTVAVWAAASRTNWPASFAERGVEVPSAERAARAVAAARASGARTLVAFLHAGIEKTNRPSPEDVKLLRAVADAGFDLVVACHSHRTSGYALVERADGSTGVCLYGLGSLASSVLNGADEHEGLVALLGLDADGRPARIAYEALVLGADGVAVCATGEARERVCERVERVAREVADGSYRSAFYGDTSGGFLWKQVRDTRAALRAGGLRGVRAKIKRMRPRHFRTLVDPFVRRLRR
jgi:stage V sporulation protein B